MPTILFVGGGSVGHIAPSVAVWEQCKQQRSDLTAHFVCSPRPDDAVFLQDNNLEYTVCHAPRASLTLPFKLIPAMREAKAILNHVQPDIIFSKGGYVSLPICYEAHRRHIPIMLHESDSVSGYANRIVSTWAAEVCTGFPSKYTHTGNPVRSDITQGSKERGLQHTGLKGDRPILLVIGGSQGATAINDSITAMIADILLRCDVIHITGRGKHTNLEREGYFQTKFANQELKDFYACADLAISRAGAGSLAELAANNIPTIVVPLRGVGHDHQYKNAIAAEKTGGCIHLEQSQLPSKLLPQIHNLVTNQELRRKMSTQMRSLNTPDAALQIAKIMLQTLDNTRRHE